MTLNVRFPAPFPVTVVGQGGITVFKEGGVWYIQPKFSDLAEILPAALLNPSSRQVWIYDPVGDEYNVLTLNGLVEALHAATSMTSLTIGTGARTFTTGAGKDFPVGSFVLATSDADPGNYMLGQVTDYANTSLTIDVSNIGGGGTHADWTLRAASPVGPQGPSGQDGAGYAASSATSLSIGAGSRTFETQAGLAYSTGARLRASSAANGANYMEGLVTSYGGTTLTMDVSRTGGSGTYADWNLNLAGDPGLDGSGIGDVTAASAFGADNRMIRSDGTGKGVQASGVAIDDGNNISGVSNLTTSGVIELGHASDTTLSRESAGVIAVEGVPLYSHIPQNSQSGPYTLVLADAQKHILHPASDNNPRTFTIPANASVAFPIGTVITFINKVNTVTIAITSDTMTWAGYGITGSRALAENGVATAVKIASTEWVITGSGLS